MVASEQEGEVSNGLINFHERGEVNVSDDAGWQHQLHKLHTYRINTIKLFYIYN